MGLYTPTILGGNSCLSWFYDRGAIKDPPHTGTSKGLSQAINWGPIRKFLPKYANAYVTIQNHGLSAGVRSHYVTANGVRKGTQRADTWGRDRVSLVTDGKLPQPYGRRLKVIVTRSWRRLERIEGWQEPYGGDSKAMVKIKERIGG